MDKIGAEISHIRLLFKSIHCFCKVCEKFAFCLMIFFMHKRSTKM